MRLDEIVVNGLMAETSDAAQQFEALAALHRVYGSLEFVQSRTELLREAATYAAEQTYTLPALAAALPGRCEALGPEQVRWRLDFETPEQQDVFERSPGLLQRYRKNAGDTDVSDEATARVLEGHLRLDGSCTWRLPLAFQTPLTQRVRVRWRDDGTRGASRFITVLGLRDERKHISSNESGDLAVYDAEKGVDIEDWPLSEFFYGRYYDVQTSVDATHASTTVNGAARAKLDAHGVGSGDVAIMVHSRMSCEIDFYDIEGKVDEASAKRLWVKLRLASAGW